MKKPTLEEQSRILILTAQSRSENGQQWFGVSVQTGIKFLDELSTTSPLGIEHIVIDLLALDIPESSIINSVFELGTEPNPNIYEILDALGTSLRSGTEPLTENQQISLLRISANMTDLLI